MPRTIEASGRSIDEAIFNGLKELEIWARLHISCISPKRQANSSPPPACCCSTATRTTTRPAAHTP